MDFYFIGLGGLIWLLAYALVVGCARLQDSEVRS